MTIKEHTPLALYTTFRVGGPARYFVEVRSVEEVKEAIKFAKKENLPILVLAYGSNMIISSAGFPGLVINVAIDFFEIKGKILTSGAGTLMNDLVYGSADQNLAGLEWAGGLPGTLGGAIRGNAGAFAGEIKDTVKTVTSINIKTGREITRDNKQCKFVYRGSIFKDKKDEIIVSATLELQKGEKEKLREIAEQHIEYRYDRHPMNYPNAGSVFKNTPLTRIPPSTVEKFKDVIKNDPFPVIPTAKIIADSDLAGFTIGGAQVSTKHTNYVINLGNATAEDIVAVIEQVKRKVYDTFGIVLDTEQELVGF